MRISDDVIRAGDVVVVFVVGGGGCVYFYL